MREKLYIVLEKRVVRIPVYKVASSTCFVCFCSPLEFSRV